MLQVWLNYTEGRPEIKEMLLKLQVQAGILKECLWAGGPTKLSWRAQCRNPEAVRRCSVSLVETEECSLCWVWEEDGA